MIETFRQGAPAELWQALVREAAANVGQALDETQESYLVFVLLRYQRESHCFASAEALRWLHAQSLAGSARTDALRDVGDRCLLIAGLFPGMAERRRVGVQYFVELGRGAYQEIADAGRATYAGLYVQLARRYRELVRIMAAIRVQAAIPARR